MQQVQLYIGDQRIELFKDETISLTNSIQNVKDVARCLQTLPRHSLFLQPNQTIRYLNTITILTSLEGLMQDLKLLEV